MVSYNLIIKRSAEKDFKPIPKEDRKRLIMKIRQLSVEPRLVGAEKLKGQEYWRIRQGDYRIVYAIDDTSKTVVVERVGHRKEIYR